jgi:hypothetical protein
VPFNYIKGGNLKFGLFCSVHSRNKKKSDNSIEPMIHSAFLQGINTIPAFKTVKNNKSVKK